MTTIQNNSITRMLMVNNNVSRKLGPVITSSDSLCFSGSQCLFRRRTALPFVSLRLLLLYSDSAEKPCLRPFLTPSPRPLICLPVCLELFLWRPLSLADLPLCRPHPDPLDPQVIKVRRAHTECWGHPESIPYMKLFLHCTRPGRPRVWREMPIGQKDSLSECPK